MLSILDAITGNPKIFKSVAARAIRDSYVLQYVGCPLTSTGLMITAGHRTKSGQNVQPKSPISCQILTSIIYKLMSEHF